MSFNWSWSAGSFKEWCWRLGNLTGGSIQKTMSGSFAVRQRLTVKLPFGKLHVSGCDGDQAEVKIAVRGSYPEQASAVSYTTRERDGETELLIDGPFAGGGNISSVEVDLRVPRHIPVEARCAMGAVRANDVGKIEIRAHMGAVEVTNALTDCDVVANMGAVDVTLSPQWQGQRISIRTNMGAAALNVPANVRLDCKASSSMGKVEMRASSTPGAPVATVHSDMGSARIVQS